MKGVWEGNDHKRAEVDTSNIKESVKENQEILSSKITKPKFNYYHKEANTKLSLASNRTNLS